MLRLLEYERATVDAEGAIGLAALVAGKLPELKGKRYSSYCKQGFIRSCGAECCHDGKWRSDHFCLELSMLSSMTSLQAENTIHVS